MTGQADGILIPRLTPSPGRWQLFLKTMSRAKFLNELDEFLQKDNSDTKYATIEDMFAEIGKKWILEKRYKELISFILDEYDTGQFNPFIERLETVLLQESRVQEFKSLWKGIIKMRLERLWDYKKAYEIDKGNQAKKKRTLEQQIFTLDGISRFLKGLTQLNDTDEINKTETLKSVVEKLERPEPKPTSDKRKIDETLFWELIDTSRKGPENRFDFLDSLRDKLEAFNPIEIRKFHKFFLTKFNELNKWHIWALAYIYRRGCGDDEFDYFKAWVISMGQHTFHTIKDFEINKFQNLFSSEDPQFEEFLTIAEDIYESKTNDLMKPIKVKEQKLIGKEWNEANVTSEYSEISKMFDYKV